MGASPAASLVVLRRGLSILYGLVLVRRLRSRRQPGGVALDLTEQRTGQQKCVPHGTPTLLRCATCDTPVCPKCGIWTEVGQKCPTCGPGGRRRRRSRASMGVVLGVVLAVLAGAYLGSDTFQRSKAKPPPRVVTRTMGQEATDQGLAMVVERFECADQELEYDGERASPNGQFCFLTVHIRNDRLDDAAFIGSQQYLIDAAGRRFDFDLEGTFLYARPSEEELEDEQLFLLSEIGPGEEAEGVLVYDVPDTAKIVEVELHGLSLDIRGQPFASARGVKVKLRASVATTTTTPPGPATSETSPSPGAPPSTADPSED